MNSIQLKEWRKRLGLTQYQAAKYLGITRVTIARYETIGLISISIELACIALEIAFYLAEIKSANATPKTYHQVKGAIFMANCKIGQMLSILKSQNIL